MPEPVYFQWQNDILLKSIYPLRGMKLRDFLTFYYEIDIWKAYQDRQESELGGDIAEYKAALSQAVAQSLARYKSLRNYFLQPVENPPTERINRLHKVFTDNLGRVKDMRGEKYFVTMRILDWENEIKEVRQRQLRNTRRLFIIKTDTFTHNDAEIPTLEQENRQIEEVILPEMKKELSQLNDYLSSFSKIEKRKMAVEKTRQSLQDTRKTLQRNREIGRTRIQPLQKQLQALDEDIARMLNPPEYKPLEQYFLTINVSSHYPGADRALVQYISGMHLKITAILRFTKSDVEKARGIQAEAEKLRSYKDARETSQVAIALELGRLADFRAAILYGPQTPQQRDASAAQKTGERAAIRQKLDTLRSELDRIESELQTIDAALSAPEDDDLLRDAAPQSPSRRDIVNWKVEAYRDALKTKTDAELLEMTVERFLAQPERYPLWLQYMVIHFSGMRYRSAHGSWADPKDLLFNLRSHDLESEFKKLDDGAVDSLCAEKIKLYQSPPAGHPKSALKPGGETPPALDQSDAPGWREKINHHLRGMASPWASKRREALFNLRLDEENFIVETMSAREALAALEKYKNALPPVMWKEIESLTLLRLNTTDEKWEELSPDELAERNKTEWARYRQILNEWKAKNLTEWRAEHDRSSQLIVTRAVCNETAEHIQHIRGRSPAGGLTAKPPWYKNLEKNPPPQSTQDDRPYFKKALAEEHFRPGASILWLRFVNDFPNPWRIANPITLSNGEELLPAGFLSGQESALTGGWRYQIERNGIKRTRTRTESNGVTISEEQWLRWIHEATVVEVAKTAEGTVVLTFETALPYEDKNTSTIGVFKRYLNDLVYNIRGDVFNGTFVGYTPEGDVPSQDLDFMLDWNKILRRQRMDPLAWETYRAAYIWKGKPNIPPVSFTVIMDVAPPEKPPGKPKAEAL